MALEKHRHHKEDGDQGKALTSSHKGGGQVTLWDPLACDPFDAFGALWQGPMSLFSGFCTPGTPVDWKETADNHVFKADLPGLTKEDVKVTVEDGNMLQIVGRRREDKEDPGTWHRVERSQNTFMRRFQLPSNARVDTMKIKVENGVLTIYVPKDKNHKAPPASPKKSLSSGSDIYFQATPANQVEFGTSQGSRDQRLAKTWHWLKALHILVTAL